jgi:hypothetical protein
MFEKVEVRAYLSVQHYQGLVYLSSEATRLREVLKADRSEQNRSAYRAICVSGILTEVAFVEALINEIYADIVDGGAEVKVSERAEVVRSKWRDGIPRGPKFSILTKYELLLDFLGKKPLPKGFRIVDNVDALIDLRNSLTHFRPEDVVIMAGDAGIITVQKLQRRLLKKFPLDDFDSGFFAFFPDACLCAGAVEWGKKSVVDFADDYFQRIGCRPIYAHVRG